MKLAHLLDLILYLGTQVGMLIAAAKGSLIWLCFFGLFFLDQGMTLRQSREGKQDEQH